MRRFSLFFDIIVLYCKSYLDALQGKGNELGFFVDLSIIVPSFNEGENVETLSQKIMTAFSGLNVAYEILFIDDSRDDTPLLLAKLSQTFPQVRYVHRDNHRGLGTAVVEGFLRSHADVMIVMDADLQHPPELLPEIFNQLKCYDIVIPSRFIAGGDAGGLNVFRKFVSWSARALGQVFIKRLRHVSDCTGGYFGLRRSVIKGVALDPIGWKILIEVLVKGNYTSICELPYVFHARDAGASKMSLKEQWNYLRHIFRLMGYKGLAQEVRVVRL